MREPIRDRNRLEHIIDAIDIILQRSAGIMQDDLLADRILFGGIVYHTMIIGEAAYKLSTAFKEAHPQTNWQDITDMRHHLVHGYYQVDAAVVWDVIQYDLVPLREQIAEYLNTTDWEQWK